MLRLVPAPKGRGTKEPAMERPPAAAHGVDALELDDDDDGGGGAPAWGRGATQTEADAGTADVGALELDDDDDGGGGEEGRGVENDENAPPPVMPMPVRPAPPQSLSAPTPRTQAAVPQPPPSLPVLAGPAAHVNVPASNAAANCNEDTSAPHAQPSDPSDSASSPFATEHFQLALNMLDIEHFDATHQLLKDGTCAHVTATAIPTPMHPSFLADGRETGRIAQLPIRAGTTVAIVQTLLPREASGGAWAVLRDPTGEACAAISTAVLDDQADLDVGAAVVLRGCAIFPAHAPRRRYLAVLPQNVLAVFGQ